MRALGCTLIAGSALFAACTLITDVDREKIPQTPPPTFPETDAGDGGTGDNEQLDAGSADADAASPPDATPADAATDAAPDAPNDGG